MVVWGVQDLPPRAVPWQRAPHESEDSPWARVHGRYSFPAPPPATPEPTSVLTLSLACCVTLGTCHHVSPPPHFLPYQVEIPPGWKMPVQRAGIRKCDRVISAEPLTRCLHAERAQSAISLWMYRCCWPGAGQGQSHPSQGLGHLHATPRVSAQTLGAAGPSALCFLPPWFPNILAVSTGGREDLRGSGLLLLSLDSHSPGDLVQWPEMPRFLPPARLSAKPQPVSSCCHHVFTLLSNRTVYLTKQDS